jgi:hypothetical protein
MSESDDEVQAPKPDRIGNDFHEGGNPAPGGTVDTGDALIPPYEGRTRAAGETEAHQERRDSLERTLDGQEALEEPTQPAGSAADREGKMAPEGVGESTSRSGEDVGKQEGKEPGRQDTGREGGADRPTGTSTPRDVTGV